MRVVIPCAGESSRMSHIPKHLLVVGHKLVIRHVVDFWRNWADSYIFIIRRTSTYLLEYLPSNSVVVFQDKPEGLADAILQVESCIPKGEKFVVALGDCIYKGTFSPMDNSLGVGVVEGIGRGELSKNYLVKADSLGYIKQFKEKPTEVEGLCGMGVYFLDSRVFTYIRNRGGGDFTGVLQSMVDSGCRLRSIDFKGKYINIGSPEDLESAEELLK